MQRPRSVLGLAWLLVRRRPALGVAWALFAAVGLAGLAAGLGAGPADETPRCGLTETDWRYGEHHHDYLERFTLDEDGGGSYVLGYGQAVREDMTFAYRVEGDSALVIDDIVDHDRDGRRRPREGEIRASFSVAEGEFTFDSENPYDDADEYRYRCELSLRGFTKRQTLRLYGDRVSP